MSEEVVTQLRRKEAKTLVLSVTRLTGHGTIGKIVKIQRKVMPQIQIDDQEIQGILFVFSLFGRGIEIPV